MTDTTGNGKSPTLAARVAPINRRDQGKIITIENPAGFIHTHKKAVISPLALGSNTPSFEPAPRQSLRQNNNVTLIEEFRGVAALRIALRAADTGPGPPSTRAIPVTGPSAACDRVGLVCVSKNPQMKEWIHD